MKRKTILVIGMVDSIHFARWLNQFKDENIEFLVFPSKKFHKLHSLLISLIKQKNSNAQFRFIGNSRFLRIAGYIDFLNYQVPISFTTKNLRAKNISKVLKKNDVSYVHALELQGAGYLLTQIDKYLLDSSKVIVTNWGSDIYYFKDFPEHERNIRMVLEIADFYSAECVRDYELARNYGFEGTELPCIPNAGGFEIVKAKVDLRPPLDRKQIIIKGYGGLFGRADLAITAIPYISEKFPEYSYFIYSVTEDVLLLINNLPLEIRRKIRYLEVGKKIPQDQMMSEFRKSRIYIGCSKSDGVSTSFLEALINGTYPIQSGTSCANEWVQNGAVASIIKLELPELLHEVTRALSNPQLIDDAATKNWALADRELRTEVIGRKALTFYAS